MQTTAINPALTAVVVRSQGEIRRFAGPAASPRVSTRRHASCFHPLNTFPANHRPASRIRTHCYPTRTIAACEETSEFCSWAMVSLFGVLCQPCFELIQLRTRGCREEYHRHFAHQGVFFGSSASTPLLNMIGCSSGYLRCNTSYQR